jgi:two-component system, NarL family, nitrate/nitrite response regulator NarL
MLPRPRRRDSEDAFGRPVRVLVVDEHPIVRRSIIEVLTVVPDLIVSGEAVNAAGACRAVMTLLPDVVLIDISDRDMRGLDAAREIHRTRPETRVVALAEFSAPSVERAALEAGASRVVTRSTDVDDVVGIILDIADRT